MHIDMSNKVYIIIYVISYFGQIINGDYLEERLDFKHQKFEIRKNKENNILMLH